MNEPITLREDEWESVLRAVHELHRHQEDILKRLAALEDIAQTHGKVLVQLQTPPGAALEAQPAPAPAPEYAPGFTTDKGAGMGNFPLDDEDEPDDIFFEVDGDTCIIQLTVNGEEHWLEGVTVEGMKSIIGAAMAVLKRMEMEVE